MTFDVDLCAVEICQLWAAVSREDYKKSHQISVLGAGVADLSQNWVRLPQNGTKLGFVKFSLSSVWLID